MSGRDQTPKSFAPEDWAEAIERGGYWSEQLGSFVPVRDMTPEEVEDWEEKQEQELIERVMAQHPELTLQEAIEYLREAGMLKR